MQVKTEANKNIKTTNSLYFDYMADVNMFFIQLDADKIMQ